MRLIKVGAAALNQTPLDWIGNNRRIIESLNAARQDGVQILCLPELAVTGYGCEDAFLSAGVHEQAMSSLAQLLPHTAGLFTCFGMPVWHESFLYNAVAVVANTELLGFVVKHFLPVEGVHYEPRWFKPWPEGRTERIECLKREVPFGDSVFSVGDVKIGFEICEGAWVASRSGRLLARQGVDVILNPSASHFAFAKIETRKRVVLEGSRAFGAAYVYSNLLGNEAGRVLYDGSAIIASAGEIVALGERFSFAETVLTTGVVDIDVNRLKRNRSAGVNVEMEDEPAQALPGPIRASLEFQEAPVEPAHGQLALWETGSSIKEQEFARAVALGLFDYLRKSRSAGFVVSLSGGVDSSVTACLVRIMVELAALELGIAGVCDRLSYIPGIGTHDSVDALVRRLLTCIYQASANSSETTENAAEKLAQALSATFISVPIEPIVGAYRSLAEAAIGFELSWENHDVPLQNIQARTRGPFAWLIANLSNALLLATSNRSEAAVGYTTMDGDTCGGLSPIGGVDKAFLIHWIHWLERGGFTELGTVPALALVTSSPPTAELRPPSAQQTDEGDLMPYAVLDVVERLAIRDKQMPLEIFQVLQVEFPQYSTSELVGWVKRFFSLWSRNQWKRERYAPCFHLDDENLDPKTWCRFPILSGGFVLELELLDQFLSK